MDHPRFIDAHSGIYYRSEKENEYLVFKNHFMNRRESLKAIGLSALSAGVLIDACKTKDKEDGRVSTSPNDDDAGREEFEKERLKRLNSETFFTQHEMATITVLADIIIPKDDKSGSASDAKVP